MSDSVKPKQNFKNWTEEEVDKHKTEQRRLIRQRYYIKKRNEKREREQAEKIKLVKLREVVENNESENYIRYLDDDNESDSIEISRNNEDDTDDDTYDDTYDDNDDDTDDDNDYESEIKKERDRAEKYKKKYINIKKLKKNKDDNDNRSMRTDKRFNTTEPIFFA